MSGGGVLALYMCFNVRGFSTRGAGTTGGTRRAPFVPLQEDVLILMGSISGSHRFSFFDDFCVINLILKLIIDHLIDFKTAEFDNGEKRERTHIILYTICHHIFLNYQICLKPPPKK